MKRIIFFVFLITIGASVKAQFNTTDSLRSFINRYIRNSAVEAFQNLRLNTALIGISNYIDSAYGGQVVTFTAPNDSTARIITLLGDTLDITIRGIGGITNGDKTDITVSAGGATWTIDANAVTDAKLRQSAGLSLIGRSANSTGNVADITASSDGEIARRNGTSIGFGSINLASSAAVGSSLLPVANGGTGTASPGLVAGTNVSITGTWPNQTINSSGGGGSPAGTDQDIQYNNSSAFGGSSGRFTWNNTAKRMSIFGTSTNDLNNLDDHSLKIIGNRIYLGDTTSDEPGIIEFGDPYGASQNTPMRMSLGWMGTEEFNIGVNFHYRGQVHLKYDNTKYAQWLAYNPHYFLMQAQGIGYDWNDNAGSKVVWRFDNIESSGKAIGSILSTNGLNVIDPTTSSYQNNDGYMAQLRVSSATLGIGGVPAIRIPDSTQTFMGDLSDMGILLGLQKTGANTEFMMRNDDNNSNTNVIRLYKRRGASYGISLNDKIGFISWSTLNEFGSIANANTILAGAFRLADFFWNTTDVSGNTTEKMRLKDAGQLKLNMYGSGTFTGTPAYTLQVDASGNIIEGSAGGSGISSINGETGSSQTIAAGTGINVATTTNTQTISIPTSFITTGTYTPTITNETNIATSTAYQCQYYRVGNMVTVSGKVYIDYTTTGDAAIGMTLPISSDLGNDYELAGSSSSGYNQGPLIRADATNNRAQFFIMTSSSAGYDYFFVFTYQIL